MSIWLCDTETTGLSRPAAAVEVGLLQIDENFNILREHESLIRPGYWNGDDWHAVPIEAGAQAIHGINEADVAAAPTIEEFFDEMVGAGADFAQVQFWAHNSRYDKTFFAPHMHIAGEHCSLRTARRDLKGLANYKLGTVAAHYGVHAPEEKAHTAMGDVYTVYGILKAHVAATGRSLLQLMDMLSKPVMLRTISFGKFAGRSIMSIPRDYREHLLTLDIDADLRYTLEQLKRTGA